MPIDMTRLRHQMVEHDIAARGVRDPRVLQALRSVPREEFVPRHARCAACDDGPLPIAGGQTISQPYVVALMTEALAIGEGDTVLEVGTGSGYSAAVLAQLAGEVHTVERIGLLASEAAGRLEALGYARVQVHQSDGTLGWPEHAPYDAISVTAGGPQVPPSLKAQLKVGGRLVMPVGERIERQQLVKITRVALDVFTTEDLCAVSFVPLLGEEGWSE